MTDFGSKGNRERKKALGFEALDSRSTWSSFDDITWDDFGSGDDHSVPDPETAPVWLPSRKEARLATNAKEEDFSSEQSNRVKLQGSEVTTMDWDMADLGAVPDNLIAGSSIGTKEGSTSEALLGEDASAGTSFAFATEGDIGELFAGENDVDKGGTLLHYAWENLEDMDDIFQNGDSSFVQDADGLLPWASSSTSPDSNAVPGTSSSSELRAMKGNSLEEDVKMEFIPCDSFESSRDFNSEDDGGAASQADASASQELARMRESDKVLDMANAIETTVGALSAAKGKDSRLRMPADADKNHPIKRQALNRKRTDDRLKKHPPHQKKPSGDFTTKHQVVFPSSQPLQLKPSVPSHLQVYPAHVPPSMLMQGSSQALSYVHPGYGMVHHSPYVLAPPQQQQGEQVMMGYKSKQHFDPEQRQKLEVITPPPASGSNMTPQEKIEKLRWKQKMHRLASEQQMAKQCATSSRENTSKARERMQTHEGKTDVGMASEEDEGKVVDSTVLEQLLGIMSKLDVGTRICIRDALYRLAKSAMYRQASSDGVSISERSSSEKNPVLSRHFRLPLLETVTNPIDRTIANLLFHKRNGSTDAMVEAQSSWALQQSSPHEKAEADASAHEPSLAAEDELWEDSQKRCR